MYRFLCAMLKLVVHHFLVLSFALKVKSLILLKNLTGAITHKSFWARTCVININELNFCLFLAPLETQIVVNDLLKFPSCFRNFQRAGTSRNKCPRNRFLERFFATNTVVGSQAKKNLNASKNQA